jgi:uncharacterized protein with PQ loop repeat
LAQYCIGSETVYAIIENTEFFYLDEPVICLTGVDISMPYAQVLEEMSVPRPPDVAGAVKKMLDISMVLHLLYVLKLECYLFFGILVHGEMSFYC